MKAQVILITGAGRGIGRAAAVVFAQAGAKVCVTSRTQTELEETLAQMRAAAPQAPTSNFLAHSCDISQPKSVEALFDEAKAVLGPVQHLINNAAIATVEAFESITLESWRQTMSINLDGAFLCSQAFFKQRRHSMDNGTIRSHQSPASIVNVSSLGGLRGTDKFPGLCAYSVSKFAIVGLTETLAVEGRPLHIRVNCIAPGAVDTKMLRKAAPHLKTQTKPRDIAEVMLFLVDSTRSGALTGTTIEVHSNL